MKLRLHSVAMAAWLLCVNCALGATVNSFQSSGAGVDKLAQSTTLHSHPKQGERLSDWLLRTAGDEPDTSALHWRVDADKRPQGLLREAALKAFSGSGGAMLSVTTLRDALLALPLTGRLPLYSDNARVLQSHPDQDPVLSVGHSVVLFARPQYVSVLTSAGDVCQVLHSTGFLAMDYIQACQQPGLQNEVSRVWFVQPDGRFFDFGVASWNRETQTSLAPGSWLWVPLNAHAVAPETSGNLVRFLGTQPPLEHMPSSVLHQLARQITPTGAKKEHSIVLNPAVSYSDWGEIGLLQTPSARMAPVGSASFHFSRVWPYGRGSFMFQPLDWFSGGFRYTDVTNRAYGPFELSGDQSFKDKSIDFKIRVHKESPLVPELAVGVRDLGGTGLFASEYLVANKRWGDWDTSIGLGWGYLAGTVALRSPEVGMGGTTNTSQMFKGRVSLFGGVQYSASDKLLFKAELDGNSYKNEPQNNHQNTRSRLNFGMVYRQNPSLDWSLGLERGNTLMAGVTLHTDANGLGGLYVAKPFDPPSPPLRLPETISSVTMPFQEMLVYLSEQTGWQVRIIKVEGDTATLVADAATSMYTQDRVDRAVRALNAHLPVQVHRFVLQLREVAMPMATVVVQRDEWVAKHLRAQAPSLRLNAQEIYSDNSGFNRFENVFLPYSGGFLKVSPSYSQIVGGPDNFLLYAAGLKLEGDYRINQNTWVVGTVNQRLLDNYDQFKYTAPSNLPRVRTYQREFITSSALTLPQLQVTHVRDLGSGQFASVYGGLLEWMYGGIGGEWFYRPFMSRIGVGVDINHVRQRDFKQDFSFRDYTANTGHVTLYWDTGIQNLHATLSAGRYLAGDIGATLDVRRVFQNGVAIGAWGTKTNVPKEKFGEGSFDKGMYITLPFDVMFPRSSSGAANLVWNPLTRDGGARLSRSFTLNELTQLRSPAPWRNKPATPTEIHSAADFSNIELAPLEHPLSDIGQTMQVLGTQVSGIEAKSWLLAGGTLLASSWLDAPVDRWAQNHASGRWKQMGSVGSNIPYLLVAGTGLMYLGASSESEATTAETALRAGGYTVAANLGLRYMIGRARPTAELGSKSFDGFNNKAFQSGLPSNHTALAFALVTPFARQYDKNWLYGLAAATAFGRVQARDHWLSDTVGGAMLGYGIGSMLSSQQDSKAGVSVGVTANTISANWKF